MAKLITDASELGNIFSLYTLGTKIAVMITHAGSVGRIHIGHQYLMAKARNIADVVLVCVLDSRIAIGTPKKRAIANQDFANKAICDYVYIPKPLPYCPLEKGKPVKETEAIKYIEANTDVKLNVPNTKRVIYNATEFLRHAGGRFEQLMTDLLSIGKGLEFIGFAGGKNILLSGLRSPLGDSTLKNKGGLKLYIERIPKRVYFPIYAFPTGETPYSEDSGIEVERSRNGFIPQIKNLLRENPLCSIGDIEVKMHNILVGTKDTFLLLNCDTSKKATTKDIRDRKLIINICWKDSKSKYCKNDFLWVGFEKNDIYEVYPRQGFFGKNVSSIDDFLDNEFNLAIALGKDFKETQQYIMDRIVEVYGER